MPQTEITMIQNLLTPVEAAVRLGLSKVVTDPRRTVLAMARRGELVAVRVGKFTMIHPASVERYLDLSDN